MAFTCAVCGETHAGETRDIRMGLPQPIFLLDEVERDGRAWVGDDSARAHLLGRTAGLLKRIG